MACCRYSWKIEELDLSSEFSSFIHVASFTSNARVPLYWYLRQAKPEFRWDRRLRTRSYILAQAEGPNHRTASRTVIVDASEAEQR